MRLAHTPGYAKVFLFLETHLSCGELAATSPPRALASFSVKCAPMGRPPVLFQDSLSMPEAPFNPTGLGKKIFRFRQASLCFGLCQLEKVQVEKKQAAGT